MAHCRTSSFVNATELLQGTPAALGFAAARLAHSETVLQRGMAERVYPSAVWIVLRGGQVVTQGAIGQAQPDSVLPATTGTIYDAASLTKVFTAVLLLQSVQAGEVHLNQKVGEFLSASGASPLGNLTLRQLATHTSGLPPWKALHQSRLGLLPELFATPLAAEPGTHYAYSDLGYILLGEILTRLTQMPLDQLMQQRIFQPCAMRDTGFCPAPDQYVRLAATAHCPIRPGEILIGAVHDANAWSMNGVAGHAGIFSSAPDLARFALALQSHVLLNPPALRLLTENQLAPTLGGHSIGCFTLPNPMLPHGDLLSPQTLGHTGFTGTMLLIDPAHDLTLILLTNRVYHSFESAGMGRIRRLFANAVAGAMQQIVLNKNSVSERPGGNVM